MNGERRNTEEWFINLDEPRGVLSAPGDDNAPCEREVAIEPRVPDTAAIRLDTDLEVTRPGALGDGAYLP